MLDVQNIGSVSVIKARSALMGECLTQCRQAYEDCIAKRRTLLVINLQDSPLINSEGLEFIVDAQQGCLSRGGRVAVVEPQALCEEVLNITGVSDYVAVFPDMRSALSDFTR